MSSFKVKMRQIWFPLGEISALPQVPLAGFKGPTSKGKKWVEGKDLRGEEEKGKRGESGEGGGRHSLARHLV